MPEIFKGTRFNPSVSKQFPARLRGQENTGSFRIARASGQCGGMCQINVYNAAVTDVKSNKHRMTHGVDRS